MAVHLKNVYKVVPFKFGMEEAIALFMKTNADGFCDALFGKNPNGDPMDPTVRKKATEVADGKAKDPKFFKENIQKFKTELDKHVQAGNTWYARGYPDTSHIDKKQTVYYMNGWTCFKNTLHALIEARLTAGEIEQYLHKAFKPIKDIPLQNYIAVYTSPQLLANNVLVVAAATTESAVWTALEKTAYPFEGL